MARLRVFLESLIVDISGKKYIGKLTVTKLKNQFIVESGDYTSFKAYDIQKEEPVSSGNISGNSSPKGQGSNQPALDSDSSAISIREFLKHVNDDQGRPYVNADGAPDYGI